jgi:RIO kinase 2
MSDADVAVQAFRELESRDIRVLQALELAMSRYEFVPEEVIPRYAGLNVEETRFRLKRLGKFRLIRGWHGAYVGYVLNYAGYDCLAINALVKANVLEAFGKPLGVGKESDVYDALTPGNRRVAVKFHRLGRISFRQTKRKRGYLAEQSHVSWLYQSRLAAEKEYEALKLVYPWGIAVPEPINQNRHVVVMGMIEGAELVEFLEIPKPEKVFREILLNVRRTYLKAGIIHADLSEYNIVLKPDMHILIIDWPQYVTREHPNAEDLLKRDIRNIVRFFYRRCGLKPKLREALDYVRGLKRSFHV